MYYKILEQQFKHRQLQDKSLDMRRRILKNQRSHNFQNEYDKIKAMLDHVIIPKGLNPEYYENRIKYLEKWGRAQFKELNKSNMFYKYIIYNEKYKEVWGIKAKA